ncbi:MAG: transposase [Kiritimatiellaeota bacterium]|nr:transposase [Kiritimatiellota bacterium]
MQSVQVRAEEVESETTDEAGCTHPRCETLIFCRSAGRRQKEAAIRSRAEEQFLRALEHLRQRIESGRLKDKEKIDRAVGRVLAKHPRAARYYQVQPARNDLGAPTLHWTRNRDKWAAAEELDGCYVLRTTAKATQPEEYWDLYMTLCRAENGFRMLKGDLGLRPNYHQLEERVDAHIIITVLAYHLLRHIEYGIRVEPHRRHALVADVAPHPADPLLHHDPAADRGRCAAPAAPARRTGPGTAPHLPGARARLAQPAQIRRGGSKGKATGDFVVPCEIRSLVFRNL